MTKLAAISVDLDEVGCYAAIHGVDLPTGEARHAVYDRCLPRIQAWLAEEQIPATFFAIGADLARDENQAALRGLRDAGHEIGNHSFSHHYDLTRRPRQTIRSDIERCSNAIANACGRRPTGFRAPGYTINDTMFEELADLGFAYDSSVFSSPAYYAAKLAVLGWMGARGRTSQSIVGPMSVCIAPRNPYRVGQPYWRRGSGIVELPVGVTRLGLPFIGTALVTAGALGARALTLGMRGRAFVQIELHGFDVADAASDGLEAFVSHRPDLRRSGAAKLDVLRAVVLELRQAGYRFTTLEDAARSTLAANR
ncbi:MAG: polysaccharide deacetylase family protein [Myxococcota bacterium]